MDKTKPVTINFSGHFKLSKELGGKTNEEKADMDNMSYSWAIGNLTYAMVSTRLNIALAVKVVSRFMSNPMKEHWQVAK